MYLEEGNSKQTVKIPSDLFVTLRFFESKAKKFDTSMDEEQRRFNKERVGIGLTDRECISEYVILFECWRRNPDMVRIGYQNPYTIISTLGYCPMQFIAHLEWKYRLIIQRIWFDEGNIPHITDINGKSSALDLTDSEMQCLNQLIPTDNHIYIVQRELYEKLLAETCRYVNTPYFGSLGFVFSHETAPEWVSPYPPTTITETMESPIEDGYDPYLNACFAEDTENQSQSLSQSLRTDCPLYASDLEKLDQNERTQENCIALCTDCVMYDFCNLAVTAVPSPDFEHAFAEEIPD